MLRDLLCCKALHNHTGKCLWFEQLESTTVLAGLNDACNCNLNCKRLALTKSKNKMRRLNYLESVIGYRERSPIWWAMHKRLLLFEGILCQKKDIFIIQYRFINTCLTTSKFSFYSIYLPRGKSGVHYKLFKQTRALILSSIVPLW